MPINLQCMSLDQGRKPEYPEETPEARGEHANSTHTWRRQESNPQPWRCEANVLTTKPPPSGLFSSVLPLHYRTIINLKDKTKIMLTIRKVERWGIKAGYTLDGVPTHRRAHTHTLIHSHTTDNLEMPINLPCMSLDWGRKLEYPEETPEARGKHANSTHTHTAEAGIEPPTLEV
ncbi:hypothetical protein QTP70_031948 [Hemibagrus guttatus]|uniref:Uncharacterized protein n=1 Tax=Hemibagrus guttatus TaxID=175788 RepID=A0AAE0QQI9_9TELE|nr:hypothetical protein QTP70_031948 [Hemibagrus guttatus]